MITTCKQVERTLTCHDLALLGLWNGPCCVECHDQAAAQGNEVALVHDGFHGHSALLCCHASLMIHGFEGVPDHAMECA